MRVVEPSIDHTWHGHPRSITCTEAIKSQREGTARLFRELGLGIPAESKLVQLRHYTYPEPRHHVFLAILVFQHETHPQHSSPQMQTPSNPHRVVHVNKTHRPQLVHTISPPSSPSPPLSHPFNSPQPSSSFKSRPAVAFTNPAHPHLSHFRLFPVEHYPFSPFPRIKQKTQHLSQPSSR